MMINLFSTFDPATSSNTALNWSCISIPIIMIPMTMWSMPSQHQMPKKKMTSTISKEISSMKMNNPKGILIISLSMLWFIMISNLMGLLPYSFTSTSHISISLPMALTMWSSLTFFGWIKNTKHMLTHMLPMGTPPPLMMFMVCIETISSIIRPLTLAVRLTANMIAGHLLITLMSNTMMKTSIMLTTMITPAELALFILETAVAFIQSYVFMTLIMLYMSEVN